MSQCSSGGNKNSLALAMGSVKVELVLAFCGCWNFDLSRSLQQAHGLVKKIKKKLKKN